MTEYDASPPTEFDPADPELFVEAPKWPKVVGILSVVFGSISVFCGGVGIALAPLGVSMAEGQLNGDPPPPNMVIAPIDMVSQGVGFLINILLIIAGSTLLMRKPAARALHLLYGVAFLFAAGLGIWAQMKKQAAMDAYAQQYDNIYAQQHGQAGSLALIIGVVMMVAFLCWPAFCLVWFGLTKTKPSDITGAHDPAA
ncbi:MAG: hypothetical protein DHS20C14_18660 [Phycisphaeraceae bacterium]|nr:MAG: hypothetical protein DHS20C14_18660 [Phycisphaeraceae bacterium]